MTERARIYFELRRTFPMVRAITCWKQAKESSEMASRLLAAARIVHDFRRALGIIFK